MTVSANPGRYLPPDTYMAMVAALYDARLPVVVITTVLVLVTGTIFWYSSDPASLAMASAAIVLAAVRLTLLASFRRSAPRVIEEFRRWEWRYAVLSFAFAAALGAFAAHVFGQIPGAEELAVGLVFGYGSGIIARSSYRPWICIPSLILSSVPLMGAAVAAGTPLSIALALLLAVFCLGGIETIRFIHDRFADQITLRGHFNQLASVDALTGVANRRGLGERFDEAAARQRGMFAVHCLDLDGFKGINDAAGHAAGDEVLQVVADRIARTLRSGDVVARLGGDEFVVIQFAVSSADDTGGLTTRLLQQVAEPILHNGAPLKVGMSIGTALGLIGRDDLSALLDAADTALYRSKREGRGRATLATFSTVAEDPASHSLEAQTSRTPPS